MDIPAFYTPWLLNRLSAGFCHTLNPFGGQIYRVSLAAEDVIALAFWTRNPAPLLAHLDELQSFGIPFYINMTLTGYPQDFEPHSPAQENALRTFREMSERISPERIRWRYDPIVISSATPVEYHLRHFEALAASLEGLTHHCTFSFVQFYGKTSKNLGEAAQRAGIQVERPGVEAQQALARQLAQIAHSRGISFNACCDDHLLVEGVTKSRCIDTDLIRELAPGRADGLKPKPTRPACGCAASVDIGVYDTCRFDCAYCYATSHPTAARQRQAAHNPADTILWRPDNLRGQNLDQMAMPLKG